MNKDEWGMQRRVQGYHDLRLDGISDLVNRAKGASVLDIGCNRGMAAFEFANNGATIVAGCDIREQGILVAREWFADLRHVSSQFEVADLTRGPESLAGFRLPQYDVVLMLAVFHKLRRVMTQDDLSALMRDIGRRTKSWFGWRGTSDKPEQNDEEIETLDFELATVGLQRVHTSYLSRELGAAAIWERA